MFLYERQIAQLVERLRYGGHRFESDSVSFIFHLIAKGEENDEQPVTKIKVIFEA